MLRTLHIQNYALIESLEVDFESGLNILTGQTGAGKSIIIGALEMILGERAQKQAVRTGARRAVIEGVFDAVTSPLVRRAMSEQGIEAASHLILRREIASTYSRAYINDSPATLTVVRAVAAHLIDLHGQHQHQSLLRTETHLEMLDHFGSLGGLRKDYERRYDEVRELLERRLKLEKEQRDAHLLKERLAFEISEIDAIDPKLDEEESLEAEQRRLENAERLYSATATLYEMLYARDGATGDQLIVARNELQSLARIDAVFEAAHEEIRSAQIVVADVAALLQDYNARIEFSPRRLEEIRERLGELDRLKRKYGGSMQAVVEHRSRIGGQYDLLVNFKASLQALTEAIDTNRSLLADTAMRLSSKRHEVAERIEGTVAQELSRLGMPAARLTVSFGLRKDPAGWIRLRSPGVGAGRYRAWRHGMDEVEFKIATNEGEPSKSLRHVASGGEISRIMLALKTILAKSESLPILVFDEIDSGVSGRIARKVGESMAKLGRYHQIIAITHLPQIAALGQAHFTVEKRVEQGRSKTYIRRLEEDERAEHVARLFSGALVTDAMRKSARELMHVP